MPPSATPLEWELPRLRYSLTFEDDKRYFDDVGLDTDFFDVKFYPYSPIGSSPVFAAVSKRHIFVCRLCQTKDKDANPCEIIRIIRDDDLGALNCSCTWAKDPETQRALLCVAGRDSKVKVYNIRDGEPVTSFFGHGGEINDLATSPADPSIIASASDDTTVRIWSLHPAHRRQPCLCLLAGEGHSWNLLSVTFHDTGRYVLSAGHDQVINLWTLPDFPKEHMETPIVVHYPHFSTSEIHTGLIDCLAFFGDLILSRACHEDVIVLWRIEGFSSRDDPPSPEKAPSNHDTSKLTRSAFSAVGTVSAPSCLNGGPTPWATLAAASSNTCPQYTRLMQLHTPGCGSQFFTRFGLFNVEGHHPTLAFCNTNAKIFFWDFACFSEYHAFITAVRANSGEDEKSDSKDEDKNGLTNTLGIPRPRWLRLIPPKRRPAGNNGPNNAAASGVRRGDSAGRLRETSSSVVREVDRVEASDKDSVFSVPARASVGVGTPDPLPQAPPGTTVKIGEHYNAETLEDWQHKYDTGDPHAQLKAHKTEGTVKGLSTMGRQVAWSPEGDWCVVVGSNSRVLILQRWAHGEE